MQEEQTRRWAVFFLPFYPQLCLLVAFLEGALEQARSGMVGAEWKAGCVGGATGS